MGRFWNVAVSIGHLSTLSSIPLSSTGRVWGWFNRVWGGITCGGSSKPPLIWYCMIRRADMKIQPYHCELKFKPINKRTKVHLTRNAVSHKGLKAGPSKLTKVLDNPIEHQKEDLNLQRRPHPSLPVFFQAHRLYLQLALLPACRNPRRVGAPILAPPTRHQLLAASGGLTYPATAAGHHSSRTV